MGNNIKTNRKLFINTAFVLFCLSLLLFLYLAPEETTSPLPGDGVHEKFHLIESKKEADKLCVECHYEEGPAPLPEDHPPPYRCLFCHKRD
jgi:hypothetical protein